jgi:hypothetical protein
MVQTRGIPYNSDEWEAEGQLWLARFHGEKIPKFGESEMGKREKAFGTQQVRHLKQRAA